MIDKFNKHWTYEYKNYGFNDCIFWKNKYSLTKESQWKKCSLPLKKKMFIVLDLIKDFRFRKNICWMKIDIFTILRILFGNCIFSGCNIKNGIDCRFCEKFNQKK